MHIKGLNRDYDKIEQLVNFITLYYFMNVKIDVEGYEDEIIFGSIKLLEQRRIKYKFLEFHDKWCKIKLLCISKLLERYSFDLYLIGFKKSVRIVDSCYASLSKVFPLHIFGCNNRYPNSKN